MKNINKEITKNILYTIFVSLSFSNISYGMEGRGQKRKKPDSGFEQTAGKPAKQAKTKNQTTVEQKLNILDLPQEVRRHIFSYLAQETSNLTRINATCKTFYEDLTTSITNKSDNMLINIPEDISAIKYQLYLISHSFSKPNGIDRHENHRRRFLAFRKLVSVWKQINSLLRKYNYINLTLVLGDFIQTYIYLLEKMATYSNPLKEVNRVVHTPNLNLKIKLQILYLTKTILLNLTCGDEKKIYNILNNLQDNIDKLTTENKYLNQTLLPNNCVITLNNCNSKPYIKNILGSLKKPFKSIRKKKPNNLAPKNYFLNCAIL